MQGEYESLEEEDMSDGYGSADPSEIDNAGESLYQGLDYQDKVLIGGGIFTLAVLGAGVGIAEGVSSPVAYDLAEQGSEMAEDVFEFTYDIVESF